MIEIIDEIEVIDEEHIEVDVIDEVDDEVDDDI